MKVFQKNNQGNVFMEKERGPHDGHHVPRHIPPHERRGMLQVEFDETDWKVFVDIFGDEDTAYAAMEIIKDAPPEIQILSVQLTKVIKEVGSYES